MALCGSKTARAKNSCYVKSVEQVTHVVTYRGKQSVMIIIRFVMYDMFSDRWPERHIPVYLSTFISKIITFFSVSLLPASTYYRFSSSPSCAWGPI